MDLTEVHPLFLYASSQRDFTRQHLHEQGVPRPFFHPNPRIVNLQNRSQPKPINIPPLSYGFQPKPAGSHLSQRLKKQGPTHDDKTRHAPLPRLAFQQHSNRIPETKQKSRFGDNVQQASVQRDRQNFHSQSTRHFGEQLRNFQQGNRPKYSQPADQRGRLSPNGHDHHRGRPLVNGHDRHRKQGHENSNQNQDGHQQETFHQLATTFAKAVQEFKLRNQQQEEYSMIQPDHRFSNLHQQNHLISNERLNMQQHGRGMRVENRPQLPPRSPFHVHERGGIHINTAAGELPSLGVDSFNQINRHPSDVSFRNGKSLHKSREDEPDKKTFILIKAPAVVTTESPSFLLENIRDTPSYVFNGLTETTIQLPEIFPTAGPVGPEAPIVLDLVQIPDPSLFEQQEKRVQKPHNLGNQQGEAFRYSVGPEHQPDHQQTIRSSEHVQNHDSRSRDSGEHNYNMKPKYQPVEQHGKGVPEHARNHDSRNRESNSHHYSVEKEYRPVEQQGKRIQEEVRNHESRNRDNDAHHYSVEAAHRPVELQESRVPGHFRNHNSRNRDNDPTPHYSAEPVYRPHHYQESQTTAHDRNHNSRNQENDALRYSVDPVTSLQPLNYQEPRHEVYQKLELPSSNKYSEEDVHDSKFRTSKYAEDHSERHYSPESSNFITTPVYHKEPERQYLSPTESYPTTPLRDLDDEFYKTSPPHSQEQQWNSLPTTTTIPKPKLKELRKHLNTSHHLPISYSSSVSVVSVSQNVESKHQATPKKQKLSVKKALSSKKKAKVPANDDYISADYGDQGVPGEAGVDYPIYKDIPTTAFSCRKYQEPGFYADLETRCQVFHNCDSSLAKHSFICPNGTIFHQELFICDWWYNVKCDDSREFYSLNAGL